MWAKEVEGKLYVEMDIGVDRGLTLEQAHDLVSKIEQDSRQRLPSVAGLHTHIEFASDEVVRGRPAAPDTVSRVSGEVSALPEHIVAVQECHGLRVQEYKGKVFIALHCTVDPSLSLEQAHEAASRIEDELRQRLPDVGSVTVHVEPPGAIDE
jgi:divalent metal cation (Fe/Co/Zn/Cd) transporter